MGVSREWPVVACATPAIWLATPYDWLSNQSEADLFELIDK